jgi:hypothetical protein
MAKEQVTLYGLPVVKDRKAAYGQFATSAGSWTAILVLFSGWGPG